MKKLTKLVTISALALPIAVSATSGVKNVAAAKTSNQDNFGLVLTSTHTYKHAKHKDLKDKSNMVYQGTFMADKPVVFLDQGKIVNFKSKKVLVDKQLSYKISLYPSDYVLAHKKAFKSAKTDTSYHVKGYGWIDKDSFVK